MKLQSKILIIEDDHKFAKTLCNVLSLHNYDVCMAINGAVGIQKAFEYNPDLILCDIKMDPVNGYQVYSVLKESSMIDQVPFIFITGSSELQEIRFGMDLGADDYFVKPFNNEDLIRAIERRLLKFNKLKDIGHRKFYAMFNLTPNGIFLFDGNRIFNANPSLIKTLQLDSDKLPSYSIEDILDSCSYQKIKEKINSCLKGLSDNFSEDICLMTTDHRRIKSTLSVSVYEKYSNYSLMIGLVSISAMNNEENEVFVSDIFKILKNENVIVTDSLGEKLTDVFKQHSIMLGSQIHGFFSKRESEVLCLSMEGLPIKLIAEKLFISDRTVENHRAHLMEKTNSKNIIEVIVFALRNNLIELSKFIILGFSVFDF